MTHRYSAYGLTWVSEIAIPGPWPEFTASDSPPISLETIFLPPAWVRAAQCLTSSVRYRSEVQNDCCDPGYRFSVFGADEFFELAYSDGAYFFLDAVAERVWAPLNPALSIEDLSLYLKGAVTGLVLGRRGVISLHACAVSIGNHAVILSGESEAGKSTTAAALALRGAAVMCEDIAPLTEEVDGFKITPGNPQVCLWPDAVESLFGAPNVLPRLSPNWDKCFLPLDGRRATFEPNKRPLGVVYILAPRVSEEDAPRIEEVSAREALLHLVKTTYIDWLLDRAHRTAEFELISRMVTQIPVRRIVAHTDPARIGALCDIIMEDAASLIANRDSAVLVSGA